jgi:tetratricopeptide (TPR) repeat protein
MARARYLVQRKRWGAAESAFDQAVRARPDSSSTWMARSGFRIARGQPEKAAADMVQALRLEPEKIRARYLHALLLLALGDQAGLRRACSDSLSRFDTTTDPIDANNVAWSCLLGPDVVADREAPVRLAERAVSGATEIMKPRFLYTLGAALCRAGRFEEAIRRLEERIQKRGGESEPED